MTSPTATPATRSATRRAVPPAAPALWQRLAEAVTVVTASITLVGVTHLRMLRGLTTTAAADLGDPLYFAWQLAWVQHAAATSPGRLWTTPAFLEAPGNLAFTDTVLGYLPLGLLTHLGLLTPAGQTGGAGSLTGQAGALALLNLAWLTAAAMACTGGYALARAMGTGRVAAALAGAGFGFAPWRITQTSHVNIESVGGIALAIAFLARGNGWSLREGWQPARMSWRWIAAGWLMACWQLTFGWAVGIWFVWTLALLMLAWAAGWALTGRSRRAGSLPGPVLIAHAAGGAAFAVLGALLLVPYLRVIAEHPEARRSEQLLPLFSPPLHGLLTAPSEDWFWGQRQASWRASLRWPGEMMMSPGVVLLALALTGLVVSVWPWRRRLVLAAVTAAVAVLATGTAFPLGHGEYTYLPLYRTLPGWSAIRTPGRLMIWVTLGLCLLAAGAVARLAQSHLRLARLARYRLRLLALVPIVLVIGEGLSTMPVWPVSTSPVQLSALPAPVLVLPTDPIADYHLMLWQTDGWPVLANGYSGFDPAAQTRLRADASTFPDAASVAALRARGIRSVVLVRSRSAGTAWDGADRRPIDGLALTRTDTGDAVVYTLTGG